MSTVDRPSEMIASAETLRLPEVEWHELTNVYQCRIALTPEDEGGFSVSSLDLPGIISEGDMQADAIANVREALEGAISYYRETGQPIPWASEPEVCPAGAKERWILVHV